MFDYRNQNSKIEQDLESDELGIIQYEIQRLKDDIAEFVMLSQPTVAVSVGKMSADDYLERVSKL